MILAVLYACYRAMLEEELEPLRRRLEARRARRALPHRLIAAGAIRRA